MHRTLSRLVAVVVFAALAVISFAAPAGAEGDITTGYCITGENSGGAGARVCTPWN